MKSQMAEKDRNTTDLGLAFIIAFREYSKDFAMLFFTGKWCHTILTLQFYQSVILVMSLYLVSSQLLSDSRQDDSIGYGSYFRGEELGIIEDLPQTSWVWWTHSPDGVLDGSVMSSAI